MASFGSDRPDYGILEIGEVTATSVSAFYVPTDRAAQLFTQLHNGSETSPERIRLASFDVENNRVTVFPLLTLSSDRFLRPKYRQILSISTALDIDDLPTHQDAAEEALRALPAGFTKDFQYGLGLAKAYKVIIDTVEETTDCIHLYIGGSVTGPSGDVFFVTEDGFEAMRTEIDRITSRSNAVSSRVKSAHVYNTLAPALDLPKKEVKRGRHPVTQLMTDVVGGIKTLDAADQDGLITLAVHESRRMAAARPDALARLRADIDLVTLDALIEKYEAALDAGKTEPYWQEFFEANPFALHLAFGYTVIQVRSQASVGGRSLSGAGDKVTDYLVKNPDSNNVGVFEIKRPKARLLRQNEYRGGVYAPTEELSGSITQVLDQRYQLQRSLTALKETTRDYELEQYAIGCCLIIGRSPSEPDEQKSFELFRHSLKDVTVVTYDELLAKLKQLRDLLSREEGGPAEAPEA